MTMNIIMNSPSGKEVGVAVMDGLSRSPCVEETLLLEMDTELMGKKTEKVE